MLAVILMKSFKNRQGTNVKSAATEAGSIVGFNEKTVRRYRNDFFKNKGYLKSLEEESTRGTAFTTTRVLTRKLESGSESMPSRRVNQT